MKTHGVCGFGICDWAVDGGAEKLVSSSILTHFYIGRFTLNKKKGRRGGTQYHKGHYVFFSTVCVGSLLPSRAP